MKPRYRLFKRGAVYYAHENKSGKQQSLKTKVKREAQRFLHAMNESHQSPEINLHIARACGWRILIRERLRGNEQFVIYLK